MKKIGELRTYYIQALSALYPEAEAGSITNWVFREVLDKTTTEVLLGAEEIIPPERLEQLMKMLERLKKYEPVQYILGYTWFHDLKLSVSPDVLIPRPETEELVEQVIREHQDQKIRILDIGTGTGCIAIALKRAMPHAEVHALDVSPAALKVARENAGTLGVEINFAEADILQTSQISHLPQYDVVVSNPPYVTLAEQENMLSNVAEYEPRLALFVPNEDPFLFYKAICRFSNSHLKAGGAIWFEVNEHLAGELAQELRSSSEFNNIEIRKDLSGKQRFLKLVKQE
ncbi:MAG: peptide chain release factor N(5)-glutamine methyltransferase [Bacteroidia bacterium]